MNEVYRVAPSVSHVRQIVDVALQETYRDRQWSGIQKMRLIFGDEKFEVRVRGAPDGSWAVMPNFLPTLWGTALGSMKGVDPADGTD